jgi:hypothetical protein
LDHIKRVNLFLITALVAGVLLAFPVGDRVGDGSEYYVMLFSWAHTQRPWASPDSFQAYDNHISVRKGYVTQENLKTVFVKLSKDDQTQDFNHFWFYSLAAATLSWIPQSLGFDVGLSFTLLHLGLLILVSLQIRRRFGELGLLSFLLIILCSPIFWFINKAHTEFFTFCLTVSGLVYFACSEFVLACLLFSILSTQNPPFAAVSVGAAMFWLFQTRLRSITIKDATLILLSAGFCIIHPVYYVIRHGTFTPQVSAGGATLRIPDWKEMTAWCFDPDIGLLSNWPLGIVIIVAFAIASWSFIRTKRSAIPLRLIVFSFFYVAILSFSQAMTDNFNSGATVSVTRYAMWYLCFFVLCFYLILSWIGLNLLTYKAILMGVFFSLAVVSVLNYFPNQPETYLQPTIASRILYKYVPGIYDPLPEIFIERNTGRETGCYAGIFANWDCTKLLAFRNAVAGLGQDDPIAPIGSHKPGEIHGLAKSIKDFFASNPNLNYAYFAVTDDPVPPFISDGKKLLFSESPIERFLGGGWSIAEPWGRWTDGSRAEFWFCLNDLLQRDDLTLTIEATGWVPPLETVRTVHLELNGRHVCTLTLHPGAISSTEVLLKAEWLSKKNCLTFKIPHAVSPAASGSSDDTRRVGFGGVSLRLASKQNPVQQP